jgi:hypothetical protein
MSKWVMQAHFRHLRFNNFQWYKEIFNPIGFDPLKLPSKDPGVHWDSNSQNGNSFESVRMNPHTFLHSWEHEM